MEIGLIAAVASAVLAFVATFLGAKYRKWIGKARLFAELLNDIISAAEDDKISEDEFQSIVATAKEVVADEEDES